MKVTVADRSTSTDIFAVVSLSTVIIYSAKKVLPPVFFELAQTWSERADDLVICERPDRPRTYFSRSATPMESEGPNLDLIFHVKNDDELLTKKKLKQTAIYENRQVKFKIPVTKAILEDYVAEIERAYLTAHLTMMDNVSSMQKLERALVHTAMLMCAPSRKTYRGRGNEFNNRSESMVTIPSCAALSSSKKKTEALMVDGKLVSSLHARNRASDVSGHCDDGALLDKILKLLNIKPLKVFESVTHKEACWLSLTLNGYIDGFISSRILSKVLKVWYQTSCPDLPSTSGRIPSDNRTHYVCDYTIYADGKISFLKNGVPPVLDRIYCQPSIPERMYAAEIMCKYWYTKMLPLSYKELDSMLKDPEYKVIHSVWSSLLTEQNDMFSSTKFKHLWSIAALGESLFDLLNLPEDKQSREAYLEPYHYLTRAYNDPFLTPTPTASNIEDRNRDKAAASKKVFSDLARSFWSSLPQLGGGFRKASD